MPIHRAIIFFVLLFAFAGISAAMAADVVLSRQGKASYYANSLHGRKTASGEMYDRNQFTAAHRKFDFGTRVRVTNLLNRQTVQVTINDRGPFVHSREIDLSYAAARELGLVKRGVAPVRIDVLKH
ncbi:MAG: septal ring lytic transglycosylase RlpA family protein [Desulfococcaceae bacterium]